MEGSMYRQYDDTGYGLTKAAAIPITRAQPQSYVYMTGMSQSQGSSSSGSFSSFSHTPEDHWMTGSFSEPTIPGNITDHSQGLHITGPALYERDPNLMHGMQPTYGKQTSYVSDVFIERSPAELGSQEQYYATDPLFYFDTDLVAHGATNSRMKSLATVAVHKMQQLQGTESLGPNSPLSDGANDAASMSILARPTVVTDRVRHANEARRRRQATFFCDQCHNSFTSKYSLERHTRSHAGIKAFACPEVNCDMRFYNPDDRRRHQRNQHPDSIVNSARRTTRF